MTRENIHIKNVQCNLIELPYGLNQDYLNVLLQLAGVNLRRRIVEMCVDKQRTKASKNKTKVQGQSNYINCIVYIPNKAEFSSEVHFADNLQVS